MLGFTYVKATNDQNFKDFPEISSQKQNAPGLFQRVRKQNDLSDDQKRKSRSDKKNGSNSLT
jgi:hypothetical protein